MNCQRFSTIVISSAAIGLTGLSLQTKPLLAHSGHQNNSNKQEQIMETKEPDHRNTEIDTETETSPTPPTKVAPVSKKEPIQNSSIPFPGELVLLLLLMGPFGLFSLKRWLHKS